MLQAAAKNFGQLLALRFLAGAAEACADPSFMLITSMWVRDPVKAMDTSGFLCDEC